MTPEHEIARIKRDYKEQWPQLENHPGIQKAISDKDPIRLGEIAAMIAHGNYYDRGAARQSRLPVTAFINGEAMEFETVESAKKYIAFRKHSEPSLRVGGMFNRTNKSWTDISN